MTGVIAKFGRLKADASKWLSNNKVALLKGVAGSLVLPMVVASVTSWYANRQLENSDLMDKRIATFRDASGATFEASVANYVQDILQNGKPSSGAIRRLSDNLLSQDNSIKRAAFYLPSRDKTLVSEYTKNLVKIHGLVSTNNDVLTLRPFWRVVSKILVLRGKINSHLPA